MSEEKTPHEIACETVDRLRQEIDQLRAENKRLKIGWQVATNQATTCARCGVFKHTPVRRDPNGYICAGCLETECAELHETVSRVRKLASEDSTAEMNKRLAAEHERDQLKTEMRETNLTLARIRNYCADYEGHDLAHIKDAAIREIETAALDAMTKAKEVLK